MKFSIQNIVHYNINQFEKEYNLIKKNKSKIWTCSFYTELMSLSRTVLMNVMYLGLIVNNESFSLKSILIDSLNNLFTTSFNLSILKPILYTWLQRSLKPLIREAHCSYAEWVFCFYWASLSAGFSFLFLCFLVSPFITCYPLSPFLFIFVSL